MLQSYHEHTSIMGTVKKYAHQVKLERMRLVIDAQVRQLRSSEKKKKGGFA